MNDSDNDAQTSAGGGEGCRAEDLLAALKQQVACYQRLAKLADQQHDHVQRGHTESLLEVLGNRQKVLDEIAALEKTIGPARRRWSEFAGTLDPVRRREAEVYLTDTRRLLEQITTADRNDAMVLQQRKLNLGRQINQASTAKQINRTYAAAAYGKPSSNVDFKQ